MAKNQKQTTSKAKVGVGSAAKSSNSSSRARLLKISSLIVLAVLLVSAIGFAGYAKYQERTLKSKAAGYARVIYANGFAATACKVSTPYGYQLQVIATKPASVAGARVWVETSNNVSPHAGDYRGSTSWWYNVVSSIKVYGGNDSWVYYVHISAPYYGQRDGGPVLMAYTPNC